MGAQDYLLDLLENQREALLRLQQLVQEERACLIANDVTRLEQLIEEQNTMLAAQAQRSQLIERVLKKLAAELKLDGRPSLARVINHLADPIGLRMRTLWGTLTALTENVQQEGRVNWYLAQHALKYIDFTLRTIGQAKKGPQPYTPHSRTRDGSALQLLVDTCR